MPEAHTYADEMAALDALTPESNPARDAQHFRRIIAARKALAAAERELVEAVGAARDAGDSWTVVGAALGVSRQGAFRKFGGAEGNGQSATPRRAKTTAKATPTKRAPVTKRAPKSTKAMKATKATKATRAAKATPAVKANPAKRATAAPTTSEEFVAMLTERRSAVGG